MNLQVNRWITILFLAFMQTFNIAAFGKDNFSNDFGFWNTINISKPITEKLQSRFQFSPRLTDNFTGFNQFILHALLGYKFNEHFSFFQGYAWNTTYIPHFRREQRVYQEVNLFHNVNKISFEHRFRLDERFLQHVNGASIRGRYRLKGIFPFDKQKKWSLVLFDELFVNLNSRSGGPSSGIEQNRIYVGINRKITENLNTDLGYQLQHILMREARPDTLNHFVLFSLNFDLGL